MPEEALILSVEVLDDSELTSRCVHNIDSEFTHQVSNHSNYFGKTLKVLAGIPRRAKKSLGKQTEEGRS